MPMVLFFGTAQLIFISMANLILDVTNIFKCCTLKSDRKLYNISILPSVMLLLESSAQANEYLLLRG